MADLNVPVIDREKCTVCGACVDVCPTAVLGIEKDTLVFIQPELCTMCAECEDICPEGAVSVYYKISWADNEEKK